MRLMTPALVALLVLPALAHAQKPAAYVIPTVPAPRDPLPRFTIAPRGVALGPVGLPLPPIGLQPPSSHDRNRHRRGPVGVPWPMMVFYVPQPVVPPVPAAVAEPGPVETAAAPGRLILDVEPLTAQVFADGYYIGAAEGFSAAHGGGVLDAGTHRIDVHAAGRESVAMDVRVSPGQPLTIRAALKPLAPAVAAPSTTFYLIPGCYMGNIPPKEAGLPPTCDQSRAITWRP